MQRENEELREKLTQAVKKEQQWSVQEQETEEKLGNIKRMSAEIQELRNANALVYEKEVQLNNARNEVFYLKKEIEALAEQARRQGEENSLLKDTLEKTKYNYRAGLEDTLEEKRLLIEKMRRDLALKEQDVADYETQKNFLDDSLRRLKREYSEQLETKEVAMAKMAADIKSLREANGELDSVDRGWAQARAENALLKKQGDELKETIARLNSEINELKKALEGHKVQHNETIEANFQEREASVARFRRELSGKEAQAVSLEKQLEAQ